MFHKKNKIYLIILAIFICVVTLVNAEELNTIEQEGEKMTVYSISSKNFMSFLDNPSMDFLTNNSYGIEIYSKLIQKKGWIEINGNPTQSVEIPEGWYGRIGDLPVYSELIEFFSNNDDLQAFLVENGVADKIESAVLVNGSFVRSVDIPITAWIKTFYGNYFITIEANLITETNETGHYLYHFYTYKDYKNKFELKDGTLIVNGIDITGEYYFKLQNVGAYLPFRAVMEQLGVNIEWDSAQNAVYMNCDGKKYILETKPILKLFEESDECDLFLPPPGAGIVYSYEMINDRIIMDNETIQKCTSLVNAKVEVDVDNSIVTITTIADKGTV